MSPQALDFVADPIFDMVHAHLDIADGGSGPAVIACTGAFPDAPTVPVADFSSVIGVSLPDKVPFTPHAVPVDGAVSANPLSASYSEAYADVATIALQGLTNAVYGGYKLPATLPQDSAGSPDLAYPEAAYEEIPSSAGLDDTLSAPSITVGTVPAFYDIPEIAYSLPDIAPLSVDVPVPPTLPDADLLADPGPMQYEFTPALLEAVSRGLGGEEVLQQAAQNILMSRARRELDDAQKADERGIFDGYAEAGFDDTSGPMVAKLSTLVREGSYKDRAVYEGARTETYDRALKQVVAAVRSSLALEAASLSIHLSYAAKLVEVLRINVSIQVEYVDLLIGMFNEQLRAVKMIVAAYEDYVGYTVLGYKAQGAVIKAQSAILDTNSAKVSVMAAQTGTVEAQAQAYSVDVERSTQVLAEFNTYVKGILKNVAIARTNIDAYKSATRQYAAATESDQAKIEGYAAQVRATGSATGVYEANWDSFSAATSASGANSDALRSWYTSSNQALSAEIATFQEAATAQRKYTGVLTDWVRANSSVFTGYASAVGAEAGYVSTYNKHSVSHEEAASSVSLAAEDAKVRMDGLDAQAAAVQASINVGLTAAEATAASGCAQAAYSVRSISANLTANAGIGDTGTTSARATASDSVSRSYAYNKSRQVAV